MSRSPTRYVRGDWKTVCDSCGRFFLASDLKKRWDGLMVCKDDYELRHPQDFVRAKQDIQAVPWTRPQSTDTFVSTSAGGSGAGVTTTVDGVTINTNLIG